MVGGSPASSTTKTGRHDIAEILLKAFYFGMISRVYYTLWFDYRTVFKIYKL
jgi:hypothetical protein